MEQVCLVHPSAEVDPRDLPEVQQLFVQYLHHSLWQSPVICIFTISSWAFCWLYFTIGLGLISFSPEMV